MAMGADEDSSLCCLFCSTVWGTTESGHFPGRALQVGIIHELLLRCLHRCHPVPVRALSHALVYPEKDTSLPPCCLQPFDMQIKGRTFLSILKLMVHAFYYFNSFDSVLTPHLSISPSIFSILSFFCPQAFGQQQQWETWYQLSSEED